MPSTRRRFLASALAVAAGCTGEPPDADGSSGTASTSTSTSPTTSTSPSSTSDGPADVPSFAHWSYETPHEELGTLTLAPGADGPAVYAGSAAEQTERDDESGDRQSHSLLALSLQDGSQQWRVPLPHGVQSELLYGGDDGVPRLYVATGQESLHGDSSKLHALDPSRGEHVWEFDTEARRFLFPLAATDDAVFVGRRDDQIAPNGEYLYGLDAEDGTERWRVPSGDVLGDGNAVRRGTVLLHTRGSLSAVDPATGDRRWRYDGDGSLDGPAYDSRGKRVFVGRDGDVMALDFRDGSELWRREFDFTVSDVVTPREAMSTTVFVGDYDGRLLALSPLDGTTRWTYSVDRTQFYPEVARTSETLFVGGAGVHALDPVSGERKWSFVPDTEGHLGVHASTTVFASGGHDDAVWALDPATGDRRWRYRPGTRLVGPANAGDFAFVGVDGAVHALDGSRTP